MIIQVILAVTAILALYLVGSNERQTRAYAGIIGMAGQPLWFLSAYQAGQWGIAAVSVCYLYQWWRVYNNNKRESIGKTHGAYKV